MDGVVEVWVSPEGILVLRAGIIWMTLGTSMDNSGVPCLPLFQPCDCKGIHKN